MRWFALKFSGAIILMFLLQQIEGFTDVFLMTEEAWTQPWRFVTAIFLHGDMGHLLYNLLALALFGSVLEKFIGWKKFLFVFFAAGLLGNVVGVFVYPRSLGASGAIFGILGALAVLRPFLMVWASGVPMPMIGAVFIWAMGDLAGLFAPDDVGHVAHISGLVIGLMSGWLWRERKVKDKMDIPEDVMEKWEDMYMR